MSSDKKEIPTIPNDDEVIEYPSGTKQFWHCQPDSKRPVYYAKKGPASKQEFEAMTYGQLFDLAVEKHGDKVAMRVEDNISALEDLPKKPDGKPDIPPSKPLTSWKSWTTREYRDECQVLAKALIGSGFLRHDSCAIFGFNAPEWAMMQNAAILAGGKVAGLYPTDTPDQIAFKIDHANASVLAIDGEKTLNKIKPIISELDYLKLIVSWGDLESTSSLVNKAGESVPVMKYSHFKAFGEKEADDELNARTEDISPEDPCCLIYTSGTTGQPKAVMLSHDAVVFTSAQVVKYGLGHFATKKEQERTISYLPLSHAAGMMVDIVSPLVVNAIKPAWVTVHYARPYDMKTGALVKRLQAVRPTFFLGVPRVWEKMAEQLEKVLGKMTGFKSSLANWATAEGRKYIDTWNFDHKNPNFDYNHVPRKSFMYRLADTAALHKVRHQLGLDHSKFNFSGASPLGTKTQQFLAGFGINVNEAYGMSEGTAASTWSSDGMHLWGSVGTAFPGADVKVFKVDEEGGLSKEEVDHVDDPLAHEEAHQGELCIRSRSVMIGYMANPRLGAEHVKEIETKNAETIDEAGWLRSGDMAIVSKYGFFKITGRYKDLIIGAGGENIAPGPIEDYFKSICPIVSNIVMVGDKRKFNVALITLKLEGANGENSGTDNLELEEFNYLSIDSKTIQDAMSDEKIINEIEQKLEQTNKNGEVVVSNASKIQKFMILPRDFSIENGEITPTMKLKRGKVTDKYEKAIDKMYDSKDVYVKFPDDLQKDLYAE